MIQEIEEIRKEMVATAFKLSKLSDRLQEIMKETGAVEEFDVEESWEVIEETPFRETVIVRERIPKEVKEIGEIGK